MLDDRPMLGRHIGAAVQVLIARRPSRCPDWIFRGRWLVLFSHPADFTPVWSSETIAFQRTFGTFEEIGSDLLGLSVDSFTSHIAGVKASEDTFGSDIAFPIAEYPSLAIVAAYGMLSQEAQDSSAARILDFVASEGLTMEWILDTHPHADHFTATRNLKAKTGTPTAIGKKVVEVQTLWKAIYDWPDFPADGSQWDKPFADGETFRVGDIDARVMFSSGHTLVASSATVIATPTRNSTFGNRQAVGESA